MAPLVPGEPDLVVHVFAPLRGPQADAAYAQMLKLWSGCRSELGMSRQIEGVSLGSELPEERRKLTTEAAVAGLESPDRDFQAILRRDHELLSLSVALAPQNRPAAGHAGSSDPGPAYRPSWLELDRRWSAIAGTGSDALVGQARLYLGKLMGDPETGIDASARTAVAAAPLLDQAWQDQEAPWMHRGLMLADDIAVWEISPRDDARSERRMLALTAPSLDAELSAWVWSRGDLAMPPFARYLLHAAKVRYQLRVWAGGQYSNILCERVNDNVASLRGLLETGPRTDSEATAAMLHQLRLDEADAVTASSARRGMRRAVEIAASNIRAVLGDLPGHGEHDFVKDDQALAGWFAQQLDDETANLDAASDRAHRIGAIFAGATRSEARTAVGVAEPLDDVSYDAGSPAVADIADVVICTAVELEYQAVRRHLSGPFTTRDERGALFEIGTFNGREGDWRVAVVQTGPNAHAGIQMERAISAFGPQLALFVGVAGGRKDVQLGDVVAADYIYGYESGKDTENEYFPRIKTYSSSFRLVNYAWAVARDSSWRQRVLPERSDQEARAFVKPIAAGSVVTAHDRSRTAVFLKRYCGDAVAVEMEGYDFLEAAYANMGTHALVVRGISDLLVDKSEEADEKWQPLAAQHAAAFAFEVLARLTPPDRQQGGRSGAMRSVD